jgi:cell division protein FtsL
MVNTPSFGTPAIPSSHASRLPFLSSFWQNPEGVFFDTQEEDERILLFIRRHFITNFGWISGCMLAIVSPFLFLVGDAYLFRIVQLPLAYLIAIIAMYLIVVGTYAFVRFLEWYYNITLITNKRVLDVDFIDLIYKKISATKNTQIQDVTHEQSGTLPALFNYGNVLIQTAGTLENFHINTVPHPDMVVRIVDSVIGITDEGQTSISKEKEPDYG